MKNRNIFVAFVTLLGFYTVTFAQVTDAEKSLRAQPADTTLGWKKVNKFISANIRTQLLYDDKIKVPSDKNGNGTVEQGEAVGSKIQFKEILGVGLSYNF